MPSDIGTHTDDGLWVVNDARVEDSGAARRLFCFPHAGGGPSFFRPWRAALRPETAVRQILLPGREFRLEEPPFRRIADLVEPLCTALRPYLDRPYALFGHSMGAVVAYEVARRFSGAGVAGPTCLIVSGRRAPCSPPAGGPCPGCRTMSSSPKSRGSTGYHRRCSTNPT